MKFTFASQTKEQAEKFAGHIKAERQIDSSISEKDGKFFVEYSLADCCYDKPTSSCETPCTPSYDDLSRVTSYIFKEMQYQVNWLWAEIQYISSRFYAHQEGHLPPIKGADKMEKALNTLGIGGDYEVIKPVVYARANGGLEVDFPDAKK